MVNVATGTKPPKKRILFLSKGFDAPSTRYRARMFFPLLEESGFQVRHIDLDGNPRQYAIALLAARQSDVVVVLRKTFGSLFRNLLRRCSRRLIFDFDDAIFCNSDGTASPTRMARFAAMIPICDHVTAGNDYLAENAKRFNPRVTRLPTCLDTRRYEISPPKPVEFVDLVWIGSSSTRKYLEHSIPALQMAASRVRNLRLKIVADFDLPNVGLPTQAITWTSDGEIEALGSAHIGIAPMKDDPWTRGKCALKVLQYMAAGLPVISSPAGVNGEIVRPGENGELAETPMQWCDAITRLAENTDLRNRYGMAGQTLAASEYSLPVVFKRLISVLNAPEGLGA